MNIDLTKVYQQYKGLWIALDENLNKVLSHNKNAQKAYKQATQRGSKTPIMFKVPIKNTAYFGLNWYEQH